MIFISQKKEVIHPVKVYRPWIIVGIYSDEAASCTVIRYEEDLYSPQEVRTDAFALVLCFCPKATNFDGRIGFIPFPLWELFIFLPIG